MKTTVYVSESKRIITAPSAGAVLMQLDRKDPITGQWIAGEVWALNPDMVGAHIFGLEQAAEVVEVQKARNAADL